MFDFVRRLFRNDDNRYESHKEAVVVSCYFNPMNSPYRLLAFNMFYETIKHLNHRIIECVIGDAKPQLEVNEHIKRVYTPSLLWHKEALLNMVVADLPRKYRYVFLLDADILLTNPRWMVEGVNLLRTCNKVVQPFEYCVHLNRDEIKPSFEIPRSVKPNVLNSMVWRSFCNNYKTLRSLWKSTDYSTHGHVGFAWGFAREVLDAVPLYDKALVGGADHIIAHAAVGDTRSSCIVKAFTDEDVLQEIVDWGRKFYRIVQGDVGFVRGDLYHLWHGDIQKRDYLNRIRNFVSESKSISSKDENGLYVVDNASISTYVLDYFSSREVLEPIDEFKSGGGTFGGAGASDSWGEESKALPNSVGAAVGSPSIIADQMNFADEFKPFS